MPSPDGLSPSTSYHAEADPRDPNAEGSIEVQVVDHGDGTATVTATGEAVLLEIVPSGRPTLGFEITVECLEITDNR